jgi:hypothetical protein
MSFFCHMGDKINGSSNRIENLKLTSNKSKCVCAQSVNKISMRKLNNIRIFVNEVETQDEKNHSGAAKPRISTIQKTRLVTK